MTEIVADSSGRSPHSRRRFVAVPLWRSGRWRIGEILFSVSGAYRREPLFTRRAVKRSGLRSRILAQRGKGTRSYRVEPGRKFSPDFPANCCCDIERSTRAARSAAPVVHRRSTYGFQQRRPAHAGVPRISGMATRCSASHPSPARPPARQTWKISGERALNELPRQLPATYIFGHVMYAPTVYTNTYCASAT